MSRPATRTAKAVGLVTLAVVLVLAALTGPGRADHGVDPRLRAAQHTVFEGPSGDLYLDLEFRHFCAWRGGKFDAALRRLSRLADLIAASGRRVVFTVVPGKGLVVRENVPWREVPRARCARKGMWEQARLLDDLDSPHYVPLRRDLERDDRQTYWKTDGHWTTVGATNWTKRLARNLDPDLAGRQRYTFGSSIHVGYLNAIRGVDTPETVPTAEYAGPVRVRTDPESVHDLGPGHYTADHSWDSRPANQTWPGETLLVGDSFGLIALETLRPLFRHGRYLWTGNVPERDIAEAIGDADTVVLEVVQFFAYRNPLGTRSFRSLVRKELRTS